MFLAGTTRDARTALKDGFTVPSVLSAFEQHPVNFAAFPIVNGPAGPDDPVEKFGFGGDQLPVQGGRPQ